MKKIKIILIIIALTVLLILVLAVNMLSERPWVILPVQSTPRNLTITHYWGFPTNDIQIKLQQENTIYELDLAERVHTGESQTYIFPDLDESPVSFQINIIEDVNGTSINSSFTLNFISGRELQDHGMLIYLARFQDEGMYYIYFVSAGNKTCYAANNKKDGEWQLVKFPPILKRLPHKDPWYSYRDNDWKPDSTWKRHDN